MKHPAVLTAIIVSISLLVCTYLMSNAVISLGSSIERAGAYSRDAKLPSTLTLRTPDIGNVILRVQNGGGGGEAFRLETAEKR